MNFRADFLLSVPSKKVTFEIDRGDFPIDASLGVFVFSLLSIKSAWKCVSGGEFSYRTCFTAHSRHEFWVFPPPSSSEGYESFRDPEYSSRSGRKGEVWTHHPGEEAARNGARRRERSACQLRLICLSLLGIFLSSPLKETPGTWYK